MINLPFGVSLFGWICFALLAVRCVPTTTETAVLPTLVPTAVSLDAQGQPDPTDTATPAGRVVPPTSTPIATQPLQHFAEGNDGEDEAVSFQSPTTPAESVSEDSIPTLVVPTQTATSVPILPTLAPITITADPSAWLTYKSATNGLTMRYPAEFSLNDFDSAGLYLLTLSLGGNLVLDTAADIYQFTGFTISMMAVADFETIPEIDATNPQSFLEQVQLRESDLFKMEIVEPATMITVAGQPAATALTHRSITPDGQIQQANYFVTFLVNDQVVVILGDVAVHDQATVLPIFRAMVDSIAFEQ